MTSPLLFRSLPWAVAAVSVGLATAWLTGCSSPKPPADPPSPPEQSGPVLFEDVTVTSGVSATYRNGEEANHYAIIESLGGGVALLDYDGDGRLDMFFPGGGYFDGKKALGHPGKLFRNLGGFRFADVTREAGLTGPLQFSHGASAFDFDNDGWPDLLISGYSRLVLLHNEPDGKGGRTFVDVTAKSGLSADALWSTSTAWGDLNGDGFPDVYVCHYGNWGFDGTGPDGQPFRHPTDCMYDGKTRDVCQPGKFTQLPHALFLNNRDGTFTDVSKTAVSGGPLRKDGRGIGAILADVNSDGRPDVYAANDTDDNFLYINRGAAFGPGAAARLDEVGLVAGVARDDRGIPNGSMGVGVGDYDRTGRASLFVTNYEAELPALYQNRTATPDKPRFAYATQAAGLGLLNGVFVSWGTGFADFDLDGWEDIHIVNGHAIRHPHKAERKQKPSLLMNAKGKFMIRNQQGGTFFAHEHNCRGTAVGDLDNDGRPDLVIVRHNEPVVVLKNVAPTDGKHWVGVALHGVKNRDLVGSRVVIETASGTQTRFVKGGASYGSTDDARLHFGLGADNEVLKATVFWSHGSAADIRGLAIDGYNTIAEGSEVATPPK